MVANIMHRQTLDPQFRLQLESVYEALENGKVPRFAYYNFSAIASLPEEQLVSLSRKLRAPTRPCLPARLFMIIETH